MKTEQIAALDHIAILVDDLSLALELCSEKNWPIGKRERFEGEGTEEVYIGHANRSRLLLMQAIGPGPYQNALQKRGEGVHHFGLVCEDLSAFVSQLKTLGWTEHRRSQILWDKIGSFWLQHIGLPFLEISESKTFPLLDFSMVFPLPEILFDILPGLENGPPSINFMDSLRCRVT